MAIDFTKCIWCGGNEVVCVVCEEVIPCMFCGGSNRFFPSPQHTAHICADNLKKMKAKGVVQ